MSVTPAYAVVLVVLYSILSIRTLILRRKLGVGLGFGESPALQRAARAHANCAEYVPVTLLTLAFLELRTGPSVWLYALLSSLVLGRVVHAYGLSQLKENLRLRVAGMALTFTALQGGALALLLSYL